MPFEVLDGVVSSIATENTPGQPGAYSGSRSSGNTSAAQFIARHAGNPQLHVPKGAGSFEYGNSFVVLTGDPVLIEPAVYAAAVAAGIPFLS